MNKKKLVDLADEVLSDVDIEMEKELRDHFEAKLCWRLSRRFSDAANYATDRGLGSGGGEEAYESVKPVLDDCLDKILGEKKG